MSSMTLVPVQFTPSVLASDLDSMLYFSQMWLSHFGKLFNTHKKNTCLRFAIDWCPAKRLLIFLKSATTVCHLELDEGYPSSGQAKLLSVRKDGNLLDLSALQVKMSGKIHTTVL